jgi:hypothetical protein
MDRDLIKYMADSAVAIASEFNVKLDYSNDSIWDANKVLENFHQEYRQTKDEEEVSEIAIKFGAYIVELINKNHHEVRWEQDGPDFGENSFPLYLTEGKIVFPVAWCTKRIMDGDGDNIGSKYQTLIMDESAK